MGAVSEHAGRASAPARGTEGEPGADTARPRTAAARTGPGTRPGRAPTPLRRPRGTHAGDPARSGDPRGRHPGTPARTGPCPPPLGCTRTERGPGPAPGHRGRGRRGGGPRRLRLRPAPPRPSAGRRDRPPGPAGHDRPAGRRTRRPPRAPTASAGPTTPATAPDPDGPGTLRQGDTGPDVADLQQRLLRVPDVYRDGSTSGTYDTTLTEAVARFQLWYGVRGDETGVYGNDTRRALESRTGFGDDS
ncbi:peptidoglycan-binding protein [Streptomyces sp. Ru62]|uniref:peptidoglycan-binding protein n=1 Tax=Streptomyces sp. Ru62 TaxID=2080745 RepID=UPI0026966EE9|nr:peptidoglycan-binding protein [Streptomyces sp. Ru62]